MFVKKFHLQVVPLLVLAFAVPLLPARTPEPQPAHPIFAQHLVSQVIDANADMLDVIFHVTPPGSADNVAIAAYTAKERGAKSGDDDLGVMKGGDPLVEVQKDGVRIGVLLPLKDSSGKIIGALGLMYDYRRGQPEAPFLQRSQRIRDDLAAQIRSRGALFEPEGN